MSWLLFWGPDLRDHSSQDGSYSQGVAFLSFFTLAVWKSNFFQHLATSRTSVLLPLFQLSFCAGPVESSLALQWFVFSQVPEGTTVQISEAPSLCNSLISAVCAIEHSRLAGSQQDHCFPCPARLLSSFWLLHPYAVVWEVPRQETRVNGRLSSWVIPLPGTTVTCCVFPKA